MTPERGALISGNWKMNENHFEALKLVQELAALLLAGSIPRGREVSLHPPFTSLRTVQTAVETDNVPVLLGAQNCHFEDRGAYTGEVSAEMLARLNVRYVICGHSERRQYFDETDEIVRKKIEAIFRNGMRPIVCVGETLAERESGDALKKVCGQVRAALGGLRADAIASAVVAYEPIWAIGTGETATDADAQQMCAAVREEVSQFSKSSAEAIRIQYGGSVTPDNAAGLLGGSDVDGFLVGGASLDAARFVEIVRAGA
ncbi:MAG TPA: triose-phosphate isomerase [Acidimicrobiales bacterium]|nr:triose-phosphate isomerase [Acidimicrobiales bacterium]